MEWYKHKTASHDDPDISDALDIFGDAGYTIFFITLEIYGREFNRLDEKGNLVITKKFLKRKLRKSWTKVEKVWNFYQKRQRFFYKDLGDFVSLQVPKFIDLASNWTKRQQALPTESPTESPTVSPTAIEVEEEVEEEKKEKKNKEKEFEIFWNTYPNKKDKARAKKTYFVCVGKGSTTERILKHTERYVEECKRAETELKFIKHPATFLNATDFTEEPPEIKKESWRDLPQFRGLL